MMDSTVFDARFRSRLEALSTTNLSDAMDSVGTVGAVSGVRPMFDTPRVVGRAGFVAFVHSAWIAIWRERPKGIPAPPYSNREGQ